MEIIITTIYLEENKKFRIPHSILQITMKALSLLDLTSNRENIKKELYKLNPKFICLILQPNESDSETLAYRPSFKEEYIEVIVKIPFIQYDDNKYIEKFLDSLEVSVLMTFQILGFNFKMVVSIFEKIRKEVIGNETYRLIDL